MSAKLGQGGLAEVGDTISPGEALSAPSPTPAAWPLLCLPLAMSSVCGRMGSLQFSVLWVEEAARAFQRGVPLHEQPSS